uniref:Uncharacterized protein n=1 Tax=Octactis speculum TaxID=3111310 RepID=A0A7S2DWL6_9STRA
MGHLALWASLLDPLRLSTLAVGQLLADRLLQPLLCLLEWGHNDLCLALTEAAAKALPVSSSGSVGGLDPTWGAVQRANKSKLGSLVVALEKAHGGGADDTSKVADSLLFVRRMFLSRGS